MNDNLFYVGYSITISIIIITIIAFFIFVLYTWVDTMEKDGCDCSHLWHKDYVKFGLMFLLAYNIFIMIIINANPKMQFIYIYYISKYTYIYLDIFKLIGGLLTIIYWAIVLDYIIKLKELACGCSEDWKREFAYICSIVYFTFLLLMAIIIISILGFYYKKNKLQFLY